MRTRKSRTLLTTLGITLGVAVVLATSIATVSTVAAFREMVDSITGKADFWINGASPTGFSIATLKDVRRIPGVETANPGIAQGATLFASGTAEHIEVAGIDPTVDRRLRRYRLAAGRFLRPDERAALLVEHFAAKNKLAVGDRVTLATPSGRRHFTLVGLLKDAGAGRFMNGRVVFVPLIEAQKAFNMTGRITYIDAKARAGRRLAAVEKRLTDALSDGFIVEQPEKRVEAINEMLTGLKIGLSFFGAIALFVGGFLVYNTFAMVVVEQTQELGMLRSIGAGRAQIAAVVMTQAAVVGAVGSALGLGLGLALARLLLRYVSETVNLQVNVFSVPAGGLLLASLVGVVVTAVSAVQPALLASRVSPLAAIRIRVQRSERLLARARWLIALALLVGGFYVTYYLRHSELLPWLPEKLARPLLPVGAFLALLGAALLSPSLMRPLTVVLSLPARLILRTEGRLAADNLIRAYHRTAATAAAIMISLAMLMSIGGVTTSFRRSVDRWVDKSLGADVFVSGRSNDVAFSRSLAGKLRRLKGVRDLTIIRFVMVREGNHPVLFRAIQPRSFRRFATLQFIKGKKPEAWRTLQRGDHVFVSAVMANKRHLTVGDTIKLTTLKGERSFKVAGVAVDFGGEMGDLMIGTRADMKKYFGLNDASTFRLKVRPGVRPRDVANRITRRFGNLGLEVQDIQEFKNMVDRQVRASFAVFNVIVLLAVIVAAIGVVNTLLMNILERQREIGLLRAIGGTRGQLSAITLVEAALTGAIGGLLGLALGSYLSTDIVQGMKIMTGYEISYVFPVTTAIISLVIALGFSTAAALYPARRAASVNIVEAVQHE